MHCSLAALVFFLSIANAANIGRASQSGKGGKATTKSSKASGSNAAAIKDSTSSDPEPSDPSPPGAVDTNQPPGSYLSPIVHLIVFPEASEDDEDDAMSFFETKKNDLLFLSASGETVKKAEAAEFAIVVTGVDMNGDDSGLLTSVDKTTKLPDKYFGAKSSDFQENGITPLQTTQDFSSLGTDGQDLFGNFTFDFDPESELFPIARDLVFANSVIGEIDRDYASFCIPTEEDGIPTEGVVLQMYFGSTPENCTDMVVAVKCVVGNCFALSPKQLDAGNVDSKTNSDGSSSGSFEDGVNTGETSDPPPADKGSKGDSVGTSSDAGSGDDTGETRKPAPADKGSKGTSSDAGSGDDDKSDLTQSDPNADVSR